MFFSASDQTFIDFQFRPGGEDGKQKRVKILSPEQKDAVLSLTSPDQVPLEERRRQYNAINRRIATDRNLPPGLAEKWANAKSSQDKFLGLLLQSNLFFWQVVPNHINIRLSISVLSHLIF